MSNSQEQEIQHLVKSAEAKGKNSSSVPTSPYHEIQASVTERNWEPIEKMFHLSTAREDLNTYHQARLQQQKSPSNNTQNKFLTRTQTYEIKRQININKKKSELFHNQEKECSFHPKINEISHIISTSKIPVNERLYHTRANPRLENLKNELSQKKSEEFHEQCTFKPKLLTSSSRVANKTKPKYMKATQQICDNRSFAQKTTAYAQNTEFEKNYTFKPSTNKITSKMEKVKNYIRVDVAERLAENKNIGREVFKQFAEVNDAQIMNLSSQAQGHSLTNANNMLPHHSSSQEFSNTLTKPLQPASNLLHAKQQLFQTQNFNTNNQYQKNNTGVGIGIGKCALMESEEEPNPYFAQANDFYQRQMLYEIYKQQNKHKIKNQTNQNRQPLINNKSVKIAETLVDFDKRNEVLLNRKENFMSAKQVQNNEYTFHPKILESSKCLRKKNADEMAFLPLAEKEKRIKRMKDDKISSENKELTFKPNLNKTENKYSNIGSRVGINQDTDAYVERLNRIEERKNNANLIYQKQKEMQALTECTHRPKINAISNAIGKYSKYNNSLSQSFKSNVEKIPSYYSYIHAKENKN